MSTSTIDLAVMTVNDVIRRFPATLHVFKTWGIDACCGGAASVRDAATRHGADPHALIAALAHRIAERR